jgi:hypothetical protein
METTMLSYFQRKREEKRTGEQQAHSDYCALLRHGAEKGDLTPAEDKRLEALATQIGKNLEQMEADFALIRDLIAEERQSNNKAALQKARESAAKARRDHYEETERLAKAHEKMMEQCKAQASQLDYAEKQAAEAHDAAIGAANRLLLRQHQHWKLLGLKEQPALVRETYGSTLGSRMTPTSIEDEQAFARELQSRQERGVGPGNGSDVLQRPWQEAAKVEDTATV